MTTHVHRWQVEPCTQTRISYLTDEIDGELYTSRHTRGNLRAECWCGTHTIFHPFKAAWNLSG